MTAHAKGRGGVASMWNAQLGARRSDGRCEGLGAHRAIGRWGARSWELRASGRGEPPSGLPGAYAASNRSGAVTCESCSYRVARASKNQDFVILLYASMGMIFLHAGEETYDYES